MSPVGSCVYETWYDPPTGETVFGPADRVVTELFGSLSVLVTGVTAVDTACGSSYPYNKFDPDLMCRGTSDFKVSDSVVWVESTW